VLNRLYANFFSTNDFFRLTLGKSLSGTAILLNCDFVYKKYTCLSRFAVISNRAFLVLMEVIQDKFERSIRLTAQRRSHILETHPEMIDEIGKVREVLKNPDTIHLSSTDDSVELFYKWYENTIVGNKYMCIAVKNLATDFFVITAYYTDAIKKGKEVWKRK
jgi:hypothetical protein